MPTIDLLRCEVGSTAHGTGLPGGEDLDEMAIAVPPKGYVLGLRQWEQDIIRIDTSTGRHLGEGERSTPDTYELTRYSLHKWMRLATQGNPSILMMLWGPVRDSTPEGEALRGLAPAILSKRCLARYAGYMRSQTLRLVGEKGSGHGVRGGGGRTELIDVHGYDTKFAMHAVRLGFQGVELAHTGRVALPMEGEAGEFCRATRLGQVGFGDWFDKALELHSELERLQSGVTCELASEPDWSRVESYMIETYTSIWGITHL